MQVESLFVVRHVGQENAAYLSSQPARSHQFERSLTIKSEQEKQQIFSHKLSDGKEGRNTKELFRG